jgi:hypothetical protein
VQLESVQGDPLLLTAWLHVLQKISGRRLGGIHELAREDQGCAYTSSVKDMALSSLGMFLMPNSTKGRWDGKAWLANLAFRPSLSFR